MARRLHHVIESDEVTAITSVDGSELPDTLILALVVSNQSFTVSPLNVRACQQLGEADGAFNWTEPVRFPPSRRKSGTPHTHA
jgi:hypothetical protein